MIDTVMESIIDAIDKFWFRLNLRFDIENSEIFMAMQRFWNHALENPVILLIAAGVLIGISLTLSKLRRAKKTQEKNVDRIIESLETNEDQEKPLFPEEIAAPLAIDEDADVRVFNKFMSPGEGEDPATAIENVSSMHNSLVDDSWDTSDLLPPAGFKAEESGMHSESPTRKRFGEDIPELAPPDGNRIAYVSGPGYRLHTVCRAPVEHLSGTCGPPPGPHRNRRRNRGQDAAQQPLRTPLCRR